MIKILNKKLNLKDEYERKVQTNEFIEKISEALEKNNKLKSCLMIISNKINKKIKDFESRKNIILKKLDDFLIKFNNKNIIIFYNFSKKVINNLKGQELFYKNIYLNKMFFFFIFLLPKNNIINIDKIKNIIRNIEKGISFDIIQKEDINEIENYIGSQKMDKLQIKIFISNDEDQLRFLASMYSYENNDYCY